MSRKLIPYPCDYTSAGSLRRARRGGNILVIILCAIIVLLIGTGLFFALTNESQGWYKLVDLFTRYCPACIVTCDTPAPSGETAASRDAMPVDQKPLTSPDPNVTRFLAEPFEASEFAGIPDVVDAVSQGVVGILNYQTKTGKAEPVLAGSGSGFVYTTNGYVITNQHVIEGAAKITVTLHDGKEYDAVVVGSDIMTDVAVLKIEKEGLLALPIGDSDTARVGEFVLAIGDPISTDELSGSVTFGIVSALKREINIDGFVNEYLQTDAAVNPGNSGGPLINMRGEVIGVTSAKYTSAGYDDYGQSISSEGIGFALPINNVMEIVQSLIKNGSTVRPGIGVTIVTYLEATETVKTPGVYIYSVSEGGPAEAAGVQKGDRIAALDGKELTQDGYVEAIRAKNVGDTITLTVERNGEMLELTVIVGDMNQIHK